MTSFGALSDIKVIDLTQALAGPFGTMMLSDHGAEVIKVETPQGDASRAAGPFGKDDDQKTHGGYVQSVNRNKKSIALDLKTEDGKSVLKELVRDADALVENYRAGVMDRLGLSYEVLREINPRLVYGCLNGFGDPRTGKSPYAAWPALDVVSQAMGGLMSVSGPDADSQTPTKIGPGIGDIVPGMFLAFGVLAAVHHARRTGQGQFVDVSMVDGVLAVCERIVYQNSYLGVNPGIEGNHHPFLCPFGVFPAKDGWVTIAAPQDGFFITMCDELDIPEVAKEERFSNHVKRAQNKTDLIALINAATQSLTKKELQRRLGGKLPFGPLMQIEDMLKDEHFAARDMLPEIEYPGTDRKVRVAGVPVKMTETPGGVHRRAPFHGEDTERILREAGVDSEVIERVLASIKKTARTEL